MGFSTAEVQSKDAVIKSSLLATIESTGAGGEATAGSEAVLVVGDSQSRFTAETSP